MAILRLALLSLWNRRLTALLTVLSIALSVTLLLGVERLRVQARASFTQSITGTDLLVGARGSPVQLLLYAVFRLGNATNNISWDSFQAIAADPRVAWSVPLSLGDSHRGFRVLGTTADYFERLRFGRGQPLRFAAGGPFTDLYDAVLGATVARSLGYRLGTQIIVAHGSGDVSFARHDDKPFSVVGVLAPTGTPVDRTVHVSLAAIEAIHLDWRGGAPVPGLHISADQARAQDLTPRTITAALFGLKRRIDAFAVQRLVNEYRPEPLLAVLPGVALSELWSVLGVAESALRVVTAFVLLVGLLGLSTALLIGLQERRRELAILRSVGARPFQVLALITGEAVLLTLSGSLLGLALLSLLGAALAPIAQTSLGLALVTGLPTPGEWRLLAGVLLAGTLAGLVPGLRARRLSLADGLAMRL